MKAITGLLLLCCAAVLGQNPDANAAGGSTALKVMQDFSFVVGTWRPVARPDKPEKYAEKYTFQPILDGRFVASEQQLRAPDGKVIYHDLAVFGVDPDTGKLFLHAYNTDGSMDRTRGVDSPPGKWVFEGTVYGSPRFRDYRYTLTRLDDSHLGIFIELKNDGVYQSYSDKTYERTSQQPAVFQ